MSRRNAGKSAGFCSRAATIPSRTRCWAEGGFSPEEAQAITGAGFCAVSLGPRILRCETAPLAALAAVLTLTGDLE